MEVMRDTKAVFTNLAVAEAVPVRLVKMLLIALSAAMAVTVLPRQLLERL